MSATEMVMVITAIGGLAVIVGGQIVLIINAKKATTANTAALVANTAATDTSAKAQTANASATADNTRVVAAAIPASPTTVNVTNVPAPLPGGEFLPDR